MPSLSDCRTGLKYTYCIKGYKLNTKQKEQAMRIKDAVITVVALVLSLGVLTRMAYSEQFQQAARVESGTFDALAHDLFDGSKVASADAEGSAQ
jgi:hypothetical protein